MIITKFFISDNCSAKELSQNYKIHLRVIEESVHGNANEDNQNSSGLTNNDFNELIKALTYSSIKKCPKKRNGKTIDVKSILSFNNAILGLPVTFSARLISCLVPRETPNVESVQDLMLWTLTNRYNLNLKYGLEPVLRWFNCILQYEIIPTKCLQCLYELFFQCLDLDHVVSHCYLIKIILCI